MYAGTHGSGITFKNIAAMVSKMELITGEGKLLTLTPENNEDIFIAAQVCKSLLISKVYL